MHGRRLRTAGLAETVSKNIGKRIKYLVVLTLL